MDNLNMGDLTKNPTNLELIRLAKELAYSEYNNKKAELHNQWLKESDLAWRMHRAKVTYPPIPAFPTEADILDRAVKLIEFLNTPRLDLVKPEDQTFKEAVTAGEPLTAPETNQNTNTNTPTVEVPKIQVLPPEQDLEYAKYKIEKRQDNGANRDIAGTLMQKLNDMKLTWKK